MSNSEQLTRADHLAQEVVNAWGVNVSAGNHALLTSEFKALFELTVAYRTARETAENRRQFNILSEGDAEKETNTYEAFMEAYVAFEKKHRRSVGGPTRINYPET